MQLPDHTPEKDADLAADAAFMTASLYKMLDAHADNCESLPKPKTAAKSWQNSCPRSPKHKPKT